MCRMASEESDGVVSLQSLGLSAHHFFQTQDFVVGVRILA